MAAAVSVHRLAYLLLGAALAGVPVVAMSGRVPGPLSPFPLPSVFAVMLLGPLGALTFLLLPIAFWIGFPELSRGDGRIPGRFLGFLAAAAVPSLALTLGSVTEASLHQGFDYAWIVSVVNVLVPAALLAAYFANRARRSWPLAFLACWIYFAWLGSYAFAWMGEAP